MKIIQITKGQSVIVDDDAYDELVKYKWHLNYHGYAVRNKRIDGKRITIYLHKQIKNTPTNMEIDHINGNKLDNRKENLRICTHAENTRNTIKRKGSISKYKGVAWCKATRKWRVQIQANKETIHIGYFRDEVEAAKAYNQAAIKHHGEFAKLNVIES